MPRVRCERCGSEAKALYVREWWKARHDFDPNDTKWKSRWVCVGYVCKLCGCVKLYGREYIPKPPLESLAEIIASSQSSPSDRIRSGK